MNDLTNIQRYLAICSEAFKQLEKKRAEANELVEAGEEVNLLTLEVPRIAEEVLRPLFGAVALIGQAIDALMTDPDTPKHIKSEVFGNVLNCGGGYLCVGRSKGTFLIEVIYDIASYFDDEQEPKKCNYSDVGLNDDIYYTQELAEPTGLDAIGIYDTYAIMIAEGLAEVLNNHINGLFNNEIVIENVSDNELRAIYRSLEEKKYISGDANDFIAMYRKTKPGCRFQWEKKSPKNGCLALGALIFLLKGLFQVEAKQRTPERRELQRIAKMYFGIDLHSSHFQNSTNCADELNSILSILKH